MPDLPFQVRDRAGRLLVDGRPAGPGLLGDAWVPLEAAVCAEPPFDETYRLLVERGAGLRLALAGEHLRQVLLEELSAPEAYFSGRITISGDAGRGMQVGLALLPKF